MNSILIGGLLLVGKGARQLEVAGTAFISFLFLNELKHFIDQNTIRLQTLQQWPVMLSILLADIVKTII
jgi:hypothetical protein